MVTVPLIIKICDKKVTFGIDIGAWRKDGNKLSLYHQ